MDDVNTWSDVLGYWVYDMKKSKLVICCEILLLLLSSIHRTYRLSTGVGG